MKKLYQSPQIEVLTIELENAILQSSESSSEASSGHSLDFTMDSAW